MTANAKGGDSELVGTDSERRLHNLVYSVVYPAFLGTFLFGLLSKSNDGEGRPWGILLACYFTLQQIEGSLSGSKGYGFKRTFVDGVEIALMVVVFDALGLFPATPPLGLADWLGLPTKWLLFIIFVLPVLARFVFGRAKLVGSTQNAAFYWSLTTMSLAAAFLSLGYPECWAFVFIALLLGIYLIAFQIWNEQITDRWGKKPSSFRRTPKPASVQPTVPQQSPAEEARSWADAAKDFADKAEAAAEAAAAASRKAQMVDTPNATNGESAP